MSNSLADFFLEHNKVELEILSGKFKGNFWTEIVKVIDDHFAIRIPEYRGIKVPMEKNTLVKISAFKGKFLYTFRTNCVLVKQEYFFVPVPSPKQVLKTERRKFLRLDVVLPVKVLDFEKSRFQYMGYIVNISGGGAKVYLQEQLTPEQRYSLKFVLPDEDVEIYALSRLLRVIQEPITIHNQEYPFVHIFEYEAIDENYRDRIVRFVLNRHISQKKSGQE